MKAFLTGSYAYGKPRKNSDIDVVLLVDEATKAILLKLFKGKDTHARLGPVDLILVTDKEAFKRWEQGTAYLKRLAPVSRDFAIKYLKDTVDVNGEMGRY